MTVSRRWRKRLLLLGYPCLLLGMAVAFRLWLLIRFLRSPLADVQGSDMRFYHEWAERIAHGIWTDHHAFYGLPGYAWLLGGLYRLVPPWAGAHVMLVLQTGVSLATAMVVWLIARRILFVSPRALRKVSLRLRPARRPPKDFALTITALNLTAASAVAAYWLEYEPGIAFSLALMPTMWLVLAYWFCVWWALRRPISARWPSWLGMGLLVGGTATLVATILFVLPLLAAAARPLAWRRRLGLLAALVLGVAVGTAPAWVHNCFVVHEPAFLSAHGGINFWIGNHPAANGYPALPAGLPSGQQELLAASIRLAEAAAGHALTRPEVSRYWSQKAWAEMQQHPLHWFRLLGLKLKAFWSAFEYDDVSLLPLLRETGITSGGGDRRVGFGSFAGLGLAGLVFALGRGGGVRTVAAAVLLHLAALLPVFITERYRMAAVPGLLLLSAYTVREAFRRAYLRQWTGLGVLVAFTLTGLGLAAWPASVSLSSMQPYNVALSELEALDTLPRGPLRTQYLLLAANNLATADQHAPNNANVAFAYGRYWSAMGGRELARRSYRQAIERDAGYVDAYINLGIIALQEEQWEAAERLLTAALKLKPSEQGAAQLLQLARQRQGK